MAKKKTARLDSLRVKFDERIHTGTKKTDGSWRLKNSVDKGLVKLVLSSQETEYGKDAIKEKNDLFSPVSIRTLAKIFKIERGNVNDKLIGVKPCGEAYGHPVYDLATAAMHLVAPPADALEDIISNMKANELPPKLKKEFWDARLAQLSYQEKAGDLWRTEYVTEMLITVMKTISTSMRGFNGIVSRETGITDDQRAVINRLTDGLLVSVRDKLLDDDTLAEKVNFLHSDNEDDDFEFIGGSSGKKDEG